MVGGAPLHDGLGWAEIERLAFDPGNRWITFARDLNRTLWRHWEEDFMVLPYLHRSPLDAAKGICGTDLFADMFEEPGRVSALADWSLSVERLLKAEAPRPAGWGGGGAPGCPTTRCSSTATRWA